MTQTQHLQQIILSIMKDIDKLCRENGIEYYLFGGSALGAKRHSGFIPWDDDLDIVLLPEYYSKFIEVCKQKLDKSKYTLQEGGVDWPEHFSKIRLKGTHIKEVGEMHYDADMDGIYVDVFRVDYAADNKAKRAVQYFFGKLLLAHNMNQKKYKSDSLSKKIISNLANTLNWKPLHHMVEKCYFKYNSTPTNWVSDVMGRTRWHSAFVPRAIYGKPTEIVFEDTKFFAHEDVDGYLKITYGNYMQLPPAEKRCGLHIVNVDFGKY